MSVETKFQLCLVGRTQYKSDQESAKLDLTFTNVDLTKLMSDVRLLQLALHNYVHVGMQGHYREFLLSALSAVFGNTMATRFCKLWEPLCMCAYNTYV